MIEPKILAEYHQSRNCINTDILCHAPFTTMNFEQNGNVTPCCYNRSEIFGAYPNESLIDIWFGEKAQNFRRMVKNGSLPPGCKYCIAEIKSRNFHAVKAKTYDYLAEKFYPDSHYRLTKRGGRWFDHLAEGLCLGALTDSTARLPKNIELEISSTCNLECIMCTGYYSSSIRQHREKLPLLPSAYDDAFIHQLTEFLPHITEAKFLGGEPFLTRAYFQIWHLLASLNPTARILITTNGTILNEPVRKLLQRLRVHLVVSIDSLQKKTYEAIRRNARFENTMANLKFFRDYALTHHTTVSLAVCPMQQNWVELPDILAFCNANNFFIFFNKVFQPVEVSLQSLKLSEFIRIIHFLKDRKLAETTPTSSQNNRVYRAMVKHVADFMMINDQQLHMLESLQQSISAAFARMRSPTETHLLEAIVTRYVVQTGYGSYRYDLTSFIPDSFYWSDQRLVSLNDTITASLRKMLDSMGPVDFAHFFFAFLQTFVSLLPQDDKLLNADQVVSILGHFRAEIDALPGLAVLLNDMIKADIMFVLQLFNDLSIEQLLATAAARYAHEIHA